MNRARVDRFSIIDNKYISDVHTLRTMGISTSCLVFLIGLSLTLAFSPSRGLGLNPVYHQSVLSIATKSDGITELINGDVPYNALVGEADRAFRLGIQLEKNGQARKASAAFHEATTLYQCFLDSKSEFLYVTSLSEEECPIVLAYASLRLGFLNLDALGDAKAAVRLYKEATLTDPIPNAVSYHMMGQSLEASGAGRNLKEAISVYRKAIDLAKGDRRILFHLAVALERVGEEVEAGKLMEILRREEAVYACLVDSWGYVRWHTRKIPCDVLVRFISTSGSVRMASSFALTLSFSNNNTTLQNLYLGSRDMLQIALDAAMPLIQDNGMVCEFGVGSGRSIRMTQEILPLDVPINGFDTFTGLPQAWGNEPAGAYSTGGNIPNLEGNVKFHVGLFSETLGPFLESVGKDAFLAYANIDCDLYSSTLDILESMHGRIVPGTILIFDEYLAHPTCKCS